MATPARTAGRDTGTRTGTVLVAMTLANAMVLVDQTAVPLILPSVIQELHVGSQQAQWVITASLLALSGLLIFGGRLSDLLGRRRVFVVGSLVFAGASALAGLAWTFPVLVAFRILQGAGGALMLPTTIAIVSATYSAEKRGRALGLMGGSAAVAGAFGPVLGGAMTSLFGWRLVLLINVPLAALAVLAALRAVPRDPRRSGHTSLDLPGTVLLCVILVGFVLGLTQSQDWGWASPGVWLPLAASAAAAVGFVLVERRAASPVMDFGLLRRYRNYRGATISQAVAGMSELGLGVLLPLLLILNLGMDPGVAGLALVPTTVPMVAVAPLAGRWYDRVGGRIPLVVGFALLALSGLTLAITVHARNYWVILPGLVIFGIGLALVLTVNDPVSLDEVDEESSGQASGVSATAEQFGGAVGIAFLFILFHTVYVATLNADVDASPLSDLTRQSGQQLKDAIVAAEQTGLNPSTFDPAFKDYLGYTLDASQWGFSAAFLAVLALSAVGALLTWRTVRKPVEVPAAAEPAG